MVKEVRDSTSEDIVFKIPDGCPECGNDQAIEGNSELSSGDGKTPVCAGCGEILSEEDVELLG